MIQACSLLAAGLLRQPHPLKVEAKGSVRERLVRGVVQRGKVGMSERLPRLEDALKSGEELVRGVMWKGEARIEAST